ncbi:hypothetical protein GCM10020256_61940 [Streptomyces thermocoprophilus]
MFQLFRGAKSTESLRLPRVIERDFRVSAAPVPRPRGKFPGNCPGTAFPSLFREVRGAGIAQGIPGTVTRRPVRTLSEPAAASA